MPSRKLHDLMFVSARYTENGEEKAVWKKAGAHFAGENGKEFITLDRAFNPAGVPMQKIGEDSVILSLIEPKAKGKF